MQTTHLAWLIPVQSQAHGQQASALVDGEPQEQPEKGRYEGGEPEAWERGPDVGQVALVCGGQAAGSVPSQLP